MNLPDIPGLFAKLELLQPYHSHRKAAPGKPGCLEAQSRDIAGGDDVLAEIEAFAKGQAEGWTCFAQGLDVDISNAGLPRNKGILLSAEFVHRTADGSDPVSLHVRHLGTHWRLTTLVSGEAQRGFLVPHRFLSSRAPKDGRTALLYLNYEVFWTSDDEIQPLRATLSRFTGFSN